MKEDTTKILEAIREYMRIHGVTQQEMAEKINISRATLSNILTGRYSLSANTAKALSEAYGFNLVFLMTGEGDLERNLRKVGNVSGGAVTQGDDSPIINQNDELVRHLQEEVKFLRETIASMTKNCK